MLKRIGWLAVLIIMLASILPVYIGKVDRDVDLSSVAEIWSDVLRDVDKLGFKLTAVSEEKEMEFGKELADQILRSTGWETDPSWESYVKKVGSSVSANVYRKKMRYEFHVVNSDSVNAFALPGGQIFVMKGLLGFVESEAELAAVLGHEIAHVDLKHCVERIQYQLLLEKINLGEIGQVLVYLKSYLTAGYYKYQELEADSDGLVLMLRAGYDPQASVRFFTRLKDYLGEGAAARPKTPVSEFAGALEEALDSYYDSHPITEERIERLKEIIRKIAAH